MCSSLTDFISWLESFLDPKLCSYFFICTFQPNTGISHWSSVPFSSSFVDFHFGQFIHWSSCGCCEITLYPLCHHPPSFQPQFWSFLPPIYRTLGADFPRCKWNPSFSPSPPQFIDKAPRGALALCSWVIALLFLFFFSFLFSLSCPFFPKNSRYFHSDWFRLPFPLRFSLHHIFPCIGPCGFAVAPWVTGKSSQGCILLGAAGAPCDLQSLLCLAIASVLV
jgi:hypothetical protein